MIATTREQAIDRCLVQAETTDKWVAARRLIDGDKVIREILTLDRGVRATWFDGRSAQWYAGLSERDVNELLFEIADLLD